MTPRGGVRKASSEEADRLGRTLAAAFQDDPVLTWLVPDAARRRSTSERAFALYLRRIWLDHDETYVAGDAAGVCVWEPPGTWKLGVGEQLRLLPPIARIYGRILPRFLGTLTALEKNHPRAAHYYLPFVGVEPGSQGRGLGSLLMHPILTRCDEQGVAAYLEASTPRNRALYERHGFEVTEEFRLGRDSPPMWRMWRKPR